MKYPIGTKVKVIGNHHADGATYFSRDLVGKVGTVVGHDSDNAYFYKLKLDEVISGSYIHRFIESDLAP